MKVVDGIPAPFQNEEYRLRLRMIVELTNRMTNETETLDLFEGDGMTMGYHDWISGSFGDDPVLKPESSKLGRDQVRPPHPEH